MSRYFTQKELSCKCGCKRYITDRAFLQALDKVRFILGKPMILNSAKRCPTHNNRVSKSGFNGPHTKSAVDVRCFGRKAFNIVKIAIQCGFTGIGVSQKGSMASRYIHLDRLRGNTRPRFWSY